MRRFDSEVLRAVGFTLGNLGLEDNVYMEMLSQTFSRAWGALSFSVATVVRPGLLKAISDSL